MWYNKYIGLPYKDGGRDTNGLDCWGLVRLVYKQEYNIDLPSFVESYSTAKDSDKVHELIARHKESWEKLGAPEEGSVVLLRILGSETHVGVYLGGNQFLHIREGVDAAVESIDSAAWNRRVVGFYKYTDKCAESITFNAIPHPLKTERISIPVYAGTDLKFLSEWVKSEYDISDKLMSKSIFLLNGQPVPEDKWATTKVVEGDSLEYRALPGDGSTFRMIAFFALAVYAPYLANGLIGGAGGFSASVMAGGLTVVEAAAYAGVMIAGSSLINAIAPIRPPATPATPGDSIAQNFINGANNQQMPYGSLPVVLGKMRVTPPLGAANNVRFSGDSDIASFAENGGSKGISGRDTYIDMLLIWGYGPLSIDSSTLRIGQVNIYNNDGSSNYDNLKQITLNRISEPTSALLSAFNDIYGRDTQQHFPNQPLTYTGLPPVGNSSNGFFGTASTPWTPAPRPSTDTGWVEFAFSQPSTAISVAISFPQGLRAIVVKGDSAGEARAAPVGVQLQYKTSALGSWTNWGTYTVGGTLQTTTGTTTVQEYGCDEYNCGYYNVTVSTNQNTLLSGSAIKDAFTWTVTKNRLDTSTSGGTTTVTATNWGETDILQVRIRRVTGDNAEPNDTFRYSHQAVLQTVTSYNNANPCIDPPNSKIAKTALTIKATNEINGQIDGINAVVQTVCKDWDTATQQWVTRATSNPASLYRYVLQHPGNARPVLDSQLNLTQLQQWHDYCNQTRSVTYNGTTYTTKLEFNSILAGNQRSILDVLRDIAAAGRASPSMLDGKWSVVIDRAKDTIVQHFTPHNSWGFEASKLLPKMPEALKVQFNDRNADYVQKEIIVAYADKSASSAQLLESIQLPGVTSVAEAVDHAKWHLAQINLRPEVYTINTDIEYIVCNRGDRVKLTHDVPMWGLGSGRIKNMYGAPSGSIAANNNITILDLDEDILLDPSKNYTIRVRSSTTGSSDANTFSVNTSFNIASIAVSNNVVTIMLSALHPLNVDDLVTISSNNSSINTVGATVTSVLFNQYGPIGFTYDKVVGNMSTNIGTGTVSLVNTYYSSVQLSSATTTTNVAAQDLFLFGELNKESQDLLVTKIEPTTNKTAKITLVDYGVSSTYNIFTQYTNIASNTVFDAKITLPPIALFNQVGASVPTVDITKVISDETVLKRVGPGVYESNIKIPYTNPSGLSNDIGYVEAEVIPANMPDTSGGYLVSCDISLNSIDITNVQDGVVYRFRLRYKTKLGRLGNWTEWFGHRVVGKTSTPSAVTGIHYKEVPNTGLLLSWDKNPEIDVVAYEVRTSNTGWGTDTLYLYKGPNTTLTATPPTVGNTTVWYIRAIDSSGLYSTTSSSIQYSTVAITNVVSNTISYTFNNTSLTASTAELTWANINPPFGLANYEISYGGAVKTTKANTITIPADWLGNKVISIKVVDTLGNTSSGTSYTIFKQAPNAPVSPVSFVSQGIVNIRWSAPAVTSVAIWGYEVSTDPGFTSSGVIFKGSATSCQVPNSVLMLGSDDYFIRTIDVDNRTSASVTLSYTLNVPPDVTGITEYYNTSSLTEATVELRWNKVDCEFGTAYYELSYTDPVDGSAIAKQTMSTSIIVPANWLGNKQFTLKVVDSLNHYSSGYVKNITKLAPGSVLDARSQVIDNNVLLYWDYPAKTTLPIAHVLIKRGTETDTWQTATSIGTKSGGFTSLSELAAGKYVYFLVAVDTDNRESPIPVSVAASVSQPPDFKFNGELVSTFSGTKANAATYANELFLPVDTTETWQSHFTSRSWTTPQNQIDATYPIFIQPGTTNQAYYEEVFDYGNILGSSQITLSKIDSIVAGTVNVVTDISISTVNVDANYVKYAGVSNIFATNFRFIKVRVTATPATIGSIYKLSSLKLRLDAKQKTEAGSIAVTSGGTIVNFETEFVDVQSVTVTAAGSTPVTVVYDLKDTVLTGTYSITSNVCTVTVANHDLIAGQKVRLYFTTGTATSGLYIIQSATTSTYTISLTTANTSGNVTTYPNSMRLFAFTSNTGAAVAASTSYTIRGY